MPRGPKDRSERAPTSREEERRVAGATNKELRVSDGRETVSASGPKDSGSERAGVAAEITEKRKIV